jgi:hypothetical protein
MLLRKKDYSAEPRAEFMLRLTAAGGLAMAILSFVSPQIGMLGHGMWTTLPSTAIACAAISQLSPYAFTRALEQNRLIFILGAIYLLQAAIRFVYIDDASNLWHTFFEGPFEMLIVLYCIMALSELGWKTMMWFKYAILFGWCISLALGLPTLFEFPGVARKTMGDAFAADNAARWAPLGIGEYSVYTSFGICLGVLIIVNKRLGGMAKLAGSILLFLGSMAVILSTFTMAFVMLMVNMMASLFLWVNDGIGMKRALRAMIIFVPFLALPALYSQAGQYEQTKFIVSKVERLYQGFSTAGIAKGDETKRGDWFVEEMKAFADEPFLGYIPHVTGVPGWGHSSLSNSLVIFGIFGAGLWVATLASIFYRCYRFARSSIMRYAILLSGLTLMMSGILNPIWHSQAALCAIFSLIFSPSFTDDEDADE